MFFKETIFTKYTVMLFVWLGLFGVQRYAYGCLSLATVECVSTCCFMRFANIGYDYHCHGMGCKDFCEYKTISRCLSGSRYYCCNGERPSFDIESQSNVRETLSPKQKSLQCLYNCCLLKSSTILCSSCFRGVPYQTTVQGFGEYKIGKALLSCCLQNPCGMYAAIAGCTCLLGVGIVNTVCSKRQNSSMSMDYTDVPPNEN